MTKKELIEFLKENLTLEWNSKTDFYGDTREDYIILKIGDTEITRTNTMDILPGKMDMDY